MLKTKLSHCFLILIMVSISIGARSQVTLTNGDHILEVGGLVSTYLNIRPVKDDASNQNRNKDRFKLRNAQLALKGVVKDQLEYQVQVDFAAIGAMGTAEADPENPAIMDAFVVYKGLGFMDIKAGYSKLEYSRSSLVPFASSPYWQRPELVRGDLFSRRDVGVTLYSSPVKYVNLSAGVYTGLGEMSLGGDNDASGRFEYVGRAEFQYPSRYRDRDIDTKISPVPMFHVGVATRYANKVLPEGETFPDNTLGAYGMKLINGKRIGLAFDAAFQYKGFSTQFELHKLKSTPQSGSDPLLIGLPVEETKGYFYSGGYFVQASYFVKPAKIIVSGRYEEMDLNDLVNGNAQRVSGALAYQFNGTKSMFKFQYFNILKDESIATNRWKEQFRLGWQYVF